MSPAALPAGVRELTTRADLLAATGRAPVIAYETSPDAVAWTREGATVLCRLTQRGDPDVLGLGAAEPLGALLRDLLPLGLPALAGARGVTVDAVGEDALDGLVTGGVASWQLMVCTSGERLTTGHPDGAAPVEPGPDRYDEVCAFLDEHYTSRWTTPGHMPGERWLGYEHDGVLVAVGCVSDTPAGYPRLGGITVDRSARGLGLGRALTSWLTRAGLERSDVVVLGLDAGNPAAEHLYLDLGYATAHHWRSASLGDAPAACRC